MRQLPGMRFAVVTTALATRLLALAEANATVIREDAEKNWIGTALSDKCGVCCWMIGRQGADSGLNFPYPLRPRTFCRPED